MLSPSFAFMLAVMVEILIDVLTQGGVSVLLLVIAVGMTGHLLLRRHWTHPRAGNLLGDQT